MADTKVDVRYNSTTGEGVEEATLSSCKEPMAKDKANDSRVRNVTPRVDEGFGTHLMFETSNYEEASIVEACVIEEDKECEAYADDGIARDNDVEVKVAMD